MKIPFCPFSVRRALSVSKPFYGAAESLARIMPGMEEKLGQAQLNLSAREYMSIVLFTVFFQFSIILIPIGFLTLLFELPLFLLLIPWLVFFIAFLNLLLYPRLVIKKRVKDIERNLLHALRHLHVQVRSGVNLFGAITSAADGNYGILSEEFRYVVKEVTAGVDVENVMEDVANRNPSLHLRRTLWQVTNAMRVGGDIADTLGEIVKNMSAEQRNAVKMYGSQLNPLIMMYMLFAVIAPSLGVTFLIIMSSLSNISVGESTLVLIIIFLFVFQLLYLGMMKSRRPSIL